MVADERDKNQNQSFGATAGAQIGTQGEGNTQAQRGGTQADQITGETEKGAHNQDTENRNPQGNNPNQNQSARQ
jgi:hypothetical protein